jgi:hypothetical protein
MRSLSHAIAKLAGLLGGRFDIDRNDINVLIKAPLAIMHLVFIGIGKYIYMGMALVALCVEFVTRFHMHLANSALNQPHHVAELSLKQLSVTSAVTLALGGAATLQHMNHQADDIKAHLRWWKRSPQVLIKFLSSFEFYRCALILFTGLWGLSAFRAVSLILNIPSDDDSINLVNAAHRQAAYDLYNIQGWFLYDLLFFVVPVTLMLVSIVHHRLNNRPVILAGIEPPEERIHQSFGIHNHAAVLTVCVLTLLSLCAWYRAGILDRYMIAFTKDHSQLAPDKQLASCLWASHDPETNYACLLTWNKALEARLAQYDLITEQRTLPSNRAAFALDRMNWRARELDAPLTTFTRSSEPGDKMDALLTRGQAIETRLAAPIVAFSSPVAIPSRSARKHGHS